MNRDEHFKNPMARGQSRPKAILMTFSKVFLESYWYKNIWLLCISLKFVGLAEKKEFLANLSEKQHRS